MVGLLHFPFCLFVYLILPLLLIGLFGVEKKLFFLRREKLDQRKARRIERARKRNIKPNTFFVTEPRSNLTKISVFLQQNKEQINFKPKTLKKISSIVSSLQCDLKCC